MQTIVVNMCEKFHNDRLKNDRSLGNGKSDNNNKKKNNNNVRSAWRPVPGSKNAGIRFCFLVHCRFQTARFYLSRIVLWHTFSAGIVFLQHFPLFQIFRPGNGSPSAKNVVVVLLLVVVVRFSIP